MNEKRFTIKPQDDYWAVVDNYNEDKVCIINGIHTEIEAIWLCDFMNEQQATIRRLQDLCGKSDGENAKLRIENDDKGKRIISLIRTNKTLKEENEKLRRLFVEMKRPITIDLTEEDEKELRKLLGLIDDD